MSHALRNTALYITGTTTTPPPGGATRYRMILHMVLLGMFWLAALLMMLGVSA